MKQFRTRYRVMFNGEQYKVQYQVFRLTIFGRHWKRKWVDMVHTDESPCLVGNAVQVQLFNTLVAAKCLCREKADSDKKYRFNQKQLRKERKAMKRGKWEKVWP